MSGHGVKRLARIGAVLAVTGAVLAAPSASHAHDTTHCYHGNIYSGAWTTKYLYHYWSGNAHYNVYEHLYNGVWQHDEWNLCN
jgi:hypothetical protein